MKFRYWKAYFVLNCGAERGVPFIYFLAFIFCALHAIFLVCYFITFFIEN